MPQFIVDSRIEPDFWLFSLFCYEINPVYREQRANLGYLDNKEVKETETKCCIVKAIKKMGHITGKK